MKLSSSPLPLVDMGSYFCLTELILNINRNKNNVVGTVASMATRGKFEMEVCVALFSRLTQHRSSDESNISRANHRERYTKKESNEGEIRARQKASKISETKI